MKREQIEEIIRQAQLADGELDRVVYERGTDIVAEYTDWGEKPKRLVFTDGLSVEAFGLGEMGDLQISADDPFLAMACRYYEENPENYFCFIIPDAWDENEPLIKVIAGGIRIEDRR